MQDEAAFLQAMQEHPEDTALRLVFADWLEERGDHRGELIRLLHTLTQSVQVPKRKELEDRLRSLLSSGVQPVGPFWVNSIGMKFAWIQAGRFLMGRPYYKGGRQPYRGPQQVTLSKGFYLAIHPVTQGAWQGIIGNSPSQFQGDDLPVERVSWGDCQEFLGRLNERDGHAYRLPTEAEWEFACRAGTTTPFYFGGTISTDQANFNGYYPYGYDKGKEGVYRRTTTPVGSFPPNAWGLHDMHGNVYEWCQDWNGEYPTGELVDPQGPTEGEKRMVRGGSFNGKPSYTCSYSRCHFEPSQRLSSIGFRPVRIFP